MAENSLNTIIFKIEGSAGTSEFQSLVLGGQSAESIRGTITVAALNLSEDKDGSVLTTPGDKTRIPSSTLTRDIINDSTENLATINFVTEDSGSASIDLSDMMQNAKFIKFYQKYKGEITLSVTIKIPKTDTYNVFVGNNKLTPAWKLEESQISFDGYVYDETIILSPISDKITDLATLRQTYKTAEANYLLIKKQFESQTVGDVDLEIDTVETYEPTTFKNVITRLLEFQVGTLQPAIDYTTTAKLSVERDRLNTINKLIIIVCKMYPNITIEDGEGIPYDTDGQIDIGIGGDTGSKLEAADS